MLICSLIPIFNSSNWSERTKDCLMGDKTHRHTGQIGIMGELILLRWTKGPGELEKENLVNEASNHSMIPWHHGQIG